MRKLLLSFVVVLTASSAVAQIHTESPNPAPDVPSGDVYLPNKDEDLNVKEVREGMVKFAWCVAGRHPKEANDFVLDQTGQSWSIIEKKLDDDCVLDAVKNPGGEVRLRSNNRDILFALAEVLVQKRLGAYDPAQISAAAPLPADYGGGSAIGECAVRANPQGARTLLKTKINSKEELQAVQGLMPAFAACIPAGMKVHPDLTTLRGNIALYYYRLANAPKSQSGTHSDLQNTPSELPIGSRLPQPAYEEEPADEASRAEAFEVLQRMGECLVRADSGSSMALLSTILGTPAARQAVDKLKPRMPDCLGTAAEGSPLFGTLKLQMTESTLRGAIAGALYRLQFSSRPPGLLSKPATVAAIMPPDLSDPKDAALIASFAFAQCLTQSQPSAVRDFVLSKAGSKEEGAALTGLRPFMPPCIPIGTTIRTDRNSLRFTLAESLYRWSITAAAVPAATSVREFADDA